MDFTGMTTDQLARIESARLAADIIKAKARTGGVYDPESTVQLAEGFYGFITGKPEQQGDDGTQPTAEAATDA